MTEKEFVERVFKINRKGTDGDRINTALQIIARELAIIADELKEEKEETND